MRPICMTHPFECARGDERLPDSCVCHNNLMIGSIGRGWHHGDDRGYDVRGRPEMIETCTPAPTAAAPHDSLHRSATASGRPVDRAGDPASLWAGMGALPSSGSGKETATGAGSRACADGDEGPSCPARDRLTANPAWPWPWPV